MTMTVTGFPDGGQIPVRFSQAAEGAAPGEGMSPAYDANRSHRHEIVEDLLQALEAAAVSSTTGISTPI
jgi:hypothetical protein